jgi:hypothetical protein
MDSIIYDASGNITDEEGEPNTTSNQYIDKITIELLMNKPQYIKYLETTDPKACSKINEFHANIYKYKSIIMDITNEMCSQPDNTNRSIYITDTFSDFAKSCIKYITTKELETVNPYNKEDDDDMFSKCDDIDRKIKSDYTEENDDDEPEENSKSYWGDGAIKSQTSYDIRMLAKRRR